MALLFVFVALVTAVSYPPCDEPFHEYTITFTQKEPPENLVGHIKTGGKIMQTPVSEQINSAEEDNGRFLRRVLLGNALFTGSMAVALIIGAKPIAALSGLDYPLAYMALGIGLLPFAWFCAYTARQPELNLTNAKIILALDIVWVVASFFLLLSGWPPLTPAGKWGAAIVDEAVAMFAVLEYIGLRRMH